MLCDESGFQKVERNFISKREIEKRIFPRVLKRSLDSCMSYVFMTDVFRRLSLALCWHAWFLSVQKE